MQDGVDFDPDVYRAEMIEKLRYAAVMQWLQQNLKVEVLPWGMVKADTTSDERALQRHACQLDKYLSAQASIWPSSRVWQGEDTLVLAVLKAQFKSDQDALHGKPEQSLERFEPQRPTRRLKQQQKAADALAIQAVAESEAAGRRAVDMPLFLNPPGMLNMTALQHVASRDTCGELISTEGQGMHAAAAESCHPGSAGRTAAASGRPQSHGCSNVQGHAKKALEAATGSLLHARDGRGVPQQGGAVLQSLNDLELEKQAARKSLAAMQPGAPPVSCLTNINTTLQAAGSFGRPAEDMRISWNGELITFNKIRNCHAHWPLLLCTMAFLAAMMLVWQWPRALLQAKAVPGLLVLLACLVWLCMAGLAPLHFRQHWAELVLQQSLQDRFALDVIFMIGWSILAMCSIVRHDWGLGFGSAGWPSSTPSPVLSMAPLRALLGCCHTRVLAMLSVLLSPAMVAGWLMLRSPNKYMQHREQLVLLCRFCMSGGMMFWHVEKLSATGALLMSAGLHGLIMSCMMVRFSAFVPMQLMHVLSLLYRSSPDSVLYSLQLLALGVWAPCLVLYQWEARARSALLAHLTSSCKPRPLDGLQALQGCHIL
eukprot:gene8847-9026_t